MAYYVSPAGRDDWSGMLAEANEDRTDGPFATLKRAQQVLRECLAQGNAAQRTVLLRGGTYHLEEPLVLTPEDSGTAENPVIWAAYPGEKPVLRGGRLITGWQKGEGELWVVKIPEVARDDWYFRQLFV
ncbi:MAG: right-handed parallel beta-helix repeat-containing protein, partial [Candidatus Zipacnadales bacterium]